MLREKIYICFLFFYYLLGAMVAAIFVYVVVPNNGDATEVVPRHASEVDSQNRPSGVPSTIKAYIISK